MKSLKNYQTTTKEKIFSGQVTVHKIFQRRLALKWTSTAHIPWCVRHTKVETLPVTFSSIFKIFCQTTLPLTMYHEYALHPTQRNFNHTVVYDLKPPKFATSQKETRKISHLTNNSQLFFATQKTILKNSHNKVKPKTDNRQERYHVPNV